MTCYVVPMTDKQVAKAIALAASAGFIIGSGTIIVLANTLGWFNGN